MPINRNFQQLSKNYFFSAINRRASQFAEAHLDQRLIRLSIGDVTQPLCPCVVAALEKAAQEMGEVDTFRGYGPEQGYPFLREAIAGYYKKWNISLETEEIFITYAAGNGRRNGQAVVKHEMREKERQSGTGSLVLGCFLCIYAC